MSEKIAKYKNLLLELGDEGMLSWQEIAEMALAYMSEDNVKDMFHLNNLDKFAPDNKN